MIYNIYITLLNLESPKAGKLKNLYSFPSTLSVFYAFANGLALAPNLNLDVNLIIIKNLF